jgi:hypothetical protein
MKLIEMYTNNNKNARNRSARNAAKENNFGLQNVTKKFDASNLQEAADPYAMNYFYDVDQSHDHLKEFLHHNTGNDFPLVCPPDSSSSFRIPSTRPRRQISQNCLMLLFLSGVDV